MSSELLDALTVLEKEKGISKDIIIEAIEASSIQTSHTSGSAMTTIPKGAPVKKDELCSLHFESFFNNSLSVTAINSQGLLEREEGESKALFNIVSIFSFSTSFS